MLRYKFTYMRLRFDTVFVVFFSLCLPLSSVQRYFLITIQFCCFLFAASFGQIYLCYTNWDVFCFFLSPPPLRTSEMNTCGGILSLSIFCVLFPLSLFSIFARLVAVFIVFFSSLLISFFCPPFGLWIEKLNEQIKGGSKRDGGRKKNAQLFRLHQYIFN